MRIKWLHLSDIHFNYKNYNSELLRKDFISRITELSNREHFTHLFLTGDLLFQYGEPDDRTIHFLSNLRSAMNLSQDNVFIVPGNHDHDRSAPKALFEKELAEKSKNEIIDTIEKIDENKTSQLLDAFDKYNKCIHQLSGSDYYDSLTSPHLLVQRNGLNVLQLNTAWLDYDSEKGGPDFIGTFQLQQLLDTNESVLKDCGAINIAIGHHPLENILSKEEQDRILDLFMRYNIGLYFCGHSHRPSVSRFYEEDVLQIVCPGGYVDGYSTGGYVWGIIDTDNDFYKAECFDWNNGSWSIESKLNGTDEYGCVYFHTKRYNHRSGIVAIDAKLYDGHIPKQQLDSSIGSKNYDVILCDTTLEANWAEQEKLIKNDANKIKYLAEQGNSIHLYPLAPIPTLIRLGFELQNNINLVVHQFDRNAGRWVYNSENDTVSISLNEKLIGSSRLVVKIETSTIICDETINNTLSSDAFDTVEIATEPMGFGFPLFHSGVRDVANKVIDYLNAIVSRYESIHVFAAIPAGLSIELGRMMLKSIYNNIYLYNFSKGKYELAFILNPQEDYKPITNEDKQLDCNIVPFSETGENINVPIVGDIACGNISEAIQSSNEYFPIAESVLSTGTYFILRAKGDSMINADIDDGDLILIRQQRVANDGEIVVARVGSETALKRMYHDDERKLVILHSENDLYQDQEFSEIDIQGIAIMVIKQLHQ